MELRARDLTAILAFLREAGAPCGLDQLPTQVSQALYRLIPCLSAGYGRADPATKTFQVSLEHPELRYSAEDLSFLATHLDELPFIDLPQMLETPLASRAAPPAVSARRSTDYVPRRLFRESSVYNEVFRPKSIEYLMVLPTFRCGSRWIGGFGLQRDTRDFSSRDRAVLEAIHPHIIQMVERALLFDTLAGEAPDVRALVLAPDGRLAVASEEASGWLREFFGPTPPGRLPSRLAAYVRAHREALAPLLPLRLEREGAALTVHFAPGAGDGDAGVLFLRRAQAPANGRVALSPREKEVLHWVAEGKGNLDIAQILGCSAFTVRNHLHRIFEKLGVETRTAAAAWWHCHGRGEAARIEAPAAPTARRP